MKRLMRWAQLVLALLAFLLGLWFALDNATSVSVQIWGVNLPSLALGVWLLLFALLGLLLGYGLNVLSLMRCRRRARQLQRQLDMCRKQAAQLRLQTSRD